jgi:DNA-binding transcriptional LysR family regulator
MHLRDIQTFAVIARYGNLHSAAEALGVSQPALSKTVRRLETELGVRLLERLPHGVALTDFGRVLQRQARSLDQVDHDLRTEVSEMKVGHSGGLRLGTVPAIIESTLSLALARFAARRAVHFKLSIQLSVALLRDLRAGLLDFAIAAVPAEVPDELSWQPLWPQQTYVVARRDHHLATAPFTIVDLSHEQWLLPPADTRLRGLVEMMFVEKGITPPSVFVECDDSPVVFTSLVRSTDLLTVLTEDSLTSSAGAGLVKLPEPAATWSTQIGLFWRRGAYFSNLMQAVRESLVEVADARRRLDEDR